MEKLDARRKRTPAPAAAEPLEREVKRQTAWAVGAQNFTCRDPIYHISESFTRVFDMMGTQKIHEQTGGTAETNMKREAPGLTAFLRVPENPAADSWRQTQFLQKTSMDQVFEPKDSSARFLNRFCQNAFSRGVLSGAVLRGTGQMLLVSCLKRTAGQSQPNNLRQRKLFEGASRRVNVRGKPGTEAVYNRGQADSAVGLVTSVLENSRRLVDSFAAMAQGDAFPEKYGDTLNKMYPFLSDKRERRLIEEYSRQLKLLEKDPDAQDQRLVLKSALAKTRALVDKKRQLKFRFMTELQRVSQASGAALAVFSDQEFMLALHKSLERPPAAPPEGAPPEDQNPGQAEEEKIQ